MFIHEVKIKNQIFITVFNFKLISQKLMIILDVKL
ncbi:hypothetical protein HNQ90_002023 [Algibacter amylolyticus]|nr:hypothetical protein [Algibacter amylolyticus]